MEYVKKVLQNAEEHPNFLLLADDTVPKGITFDTFKKLTGRVYAYLQSKGMGREDLIMLYLPRGIQPIIASFGVLRNGSAFLLVEDTYEPERVAFMKKDCGCKLVIDSEVWREIQRYEPKEGYELTDPHDAAMVMYTSGSTGNPKGVIHEYGNLDRMVLSVRMTTCAPLAISWKDRFALVAPLNFIASQLILTYVLYYGIFCYVVSYDVIKNPLKTGMFLMKNQITGTFLTPSHIRKMKVKLPGLKFCIIGSEPANHVYLEGLVIHNCYLMTESGFLVCHYVIDKEYDKTPVGDSEFGHEILLLDEQGNEVPQGEEGEVCFENQYVRGYINLPEETATHFVDNLYHSGDLAYRDEQGRIVISGRLSDMVKVNGNRVEPGEIENAAKRVLGLEIAVCRIFQDDRSTMICLYYTDKKMKYTQEEATKLLSEYLPYYMLPNFYIHIDKVPLKANGKMDRKALPKPDTKDSLSDYVAPSDEIEERLCAAFEKALDMPKIGVEDDFYKLGGDSLAAMELLVSADLNGLNASDIFAGKTPKKIAGIWKEAHPDGAGEPTADIDERARKTDHSLSSYQTYMIDYQLYTPISTMLNLNALFKVPLPEFDWDRLTEALRRAVMNHPALMTRLFYNRDGELAQRYEPEYAPEIHIEKYSVFDFKQIQRDLIKPFKILDARLYRLRVFDVEGEGYVFFDVHHTVFDGTSFQVLLQDILQAYYDTPLLPDYYYAMVQQNEAMEGSPRYLAAQKYFHELYDQTDFVGLPTFDRKTRENTLGQYTVPMNKDAEALAVLEEKYGVSGNAFFNVVSMLTIALYNRKPNVQISWTYNGRDDLMKNQIVGLLLKDLPVMLRLTRSRSVLDIYNDVQEQVANGIANSCYPYTTKSSSVVEDDRACFLYQRNIRDAGGAALERIELEQSAAAAENAMDIQVLDDSTGLSLAIDYAASRYDEASIKRFGKLFVAVTETLLSMAQREDATVMDVIRQTEKRAGERELLIRWIK